MTKQVRLQGRDQNEVELSFISDNKKIGFGFKKSVMDT